MHDRLDFEDARGSVRALEVVDVTSQGVWAELSKTIYIVPGTRLFRRGVEGETAAAAVGELTARAGAVLLRSGDTLVVTRNLTPGRSATRDARGRLLTPARIGCTLPEVFEDVRSGDGIWFDDGKIGGTVERVESDRVWVTIHHARERGEKLKSDRSARRRMCP